MPAKYQNFGLKRISNLSDLPSTPEAIAKLKREGVINTFPSAEEGLSNLLNNLTNEPFVKDDLTIAIKNASISGVKATDIINIKGTLPTYQNSSGTVVPMKPIVTLQDQIENFKLMTEDPPAFSGGSGLKVRFLDSIFLNTANTLIITFVDANTVSDNYNGSNTVPFFDLVVDPSSNTIFKSNADFRSSDSFWTNGDSSTEGLFILNNRISRDLSDNNGLIEWEGFFVPQLKGNPSQEISVETSGFISIQIKDVGSVNYRTILNVFSEDVSITFPDNSEHVANNYTRIFPYWYMPSFAIGQRISEVNGIAVPSNTNITITNINDTTLIQDSIDPINAYRENYIELSNPLTNIDSFNISSNNTITFSFVPGSSTRKISKEIVLSSRSEGEGIPIRIYNWWPRTNLTLTRETKFVLNEPELVSLTGEPFNERFPIAQLYPTEPKTTTDLVTSSLYYFNNKLRPQHNTTNTSFIVYNSVFSDYIPPSILADKVFPFQFLGFSDDRTIRVSDNTSNISTSFSEVTKEGDLFLFNINEGIFFRNQRTLQLTNEDENSIQFFTTSTKINPPPESGNNTFMLDVIGLVGIYSANVISDTISLREAMPEYPLYNIDGYNRVRNDMLIANIFDQNGVLDSTKFYRIVSEVSVNNAVIECKASDILTGNTSSNIVSGKVVVYYDKGMNDYSKLSICNDKIERVVASPVSAPSTIILLTDSTGDENGMFVYYSTDDSIIPTNTTITSVNVVSNEITLSNPILGNIPKNATLAISSNSNNIYDCIFPQTTIENVFELSDNGISTPVSNEKLKVKSLSVNELCVNTQTEVVSSNTDYSEVFPIQHANNSYHIFIL